MVSPDEGVIKDIDKPVFPQNHYFSTMPSPHIKMSVGKGKIRDYAILLLLDLQSHRVLNCRNEGTFGTGRLSREALSSLIARGIVMTKPEPPSESSEKPPIESLPAMTIEEWLEKLRRADRAFYNIMAMEVWSIAKTMDGLTPGFWSRFMINRRLAMKQLIEQRRLQNSASPNSPPSSESSRSPEVL